MMHGERMLEIESGFKIGFGSIAGEISVFDRTAGMMAGGLGR